MSCKRLLGFWLILLTITSAAAGAPAIIAYGDSLSDNGNLFKATGQPGPPYFQGRASNETVPLNSLRQISEFRFSTMPSAAQRRASAIIWIRAARQQHWAPSVCLE